MEPASDEQLEAWRALFRAQGRARRMVDAALKRGGLPALEVYDVLLELSRPEARDGLTAKALEERLLLPQYGVSRQIDRLERQGLIARRPNPGDQRSQLIGLAPEGRKLRQKMWRVYRRVIGEFFADKLRPGQMDRLVRLLATLGR